MSVRCPYCGYGMKLGDAQPGKYTPRCKQCGDRFVLVVPNDPEQPPIAIARKRAPGEEAVPSAIEAALGMGPPPKVQIQPAQTISIEATAPPEESPASGAVMETTVAEDAPAEPIRRHAYEGVEWIPPTPKPERPPRKKSPRSNPDAADPDATAPPTDAREVRGNTFDLNSPGSDNPDNGGLQAGQTVAPAAANLTAAPATPAKSQPPSAYQTAPAQAGYAGQTAIPSPQTAPPAQGGMDRPTPAAIGTPSSDRTLRQIETTGKLGGYEIVNKLGQGGMGAVYLARQVSLDRKVAVKVLSPALAGDASFVARFTREAYAAAQLTHHNIVQIHDIGEENNVHYFSMEFVEGKTLNGLVKAGGRIDPTIAVNYTLQAARGLKFAHDHAMIHRDIKPDNLLLNDQGLVKVADLGLVKRKGVSEDTASPMFARASDASVTGAAASMGTPAYMPPEQARDAASVDLRADIYSLGCTLYDLLTGHPPFTGKTAIEVITKHANEAVIPPDKIVQDVPKSLSVILLKMMAKKPQDRYSSMDEVIKVLEEYVGMSTGGAGGPFAAQDQQVRGLELSVSNFNSASWASLRKIFIGSYFGLCTLGLLLALWTSHIKVAGGLLGLEALTFVNYIVLAGISQRTYFSRKIRQYLFGAQFIDWLKVVLAIVVLIGVLVIFQLHWLWLGCLAVSFLIALVFHSTVDLALKKERRMYLLQVEGMLKTMRQQGMDEDALREFVCKHSGTHWEEFYEALFGYESKILARNRWGQGMHGRDRKKWRAMRDPIINAINALMRRRQDERQRQYFARIEERKLRAQGMATTEAKAKAQKIANGVVANAGRLRNAIDDGETAIEPSKDGVKANPVLDYESDAGDGFQREHLSYLQRTYGSIWGLLLGSQVRLVAGLIMLSVFLIWMKKDNPTLPSDILQKMHQFVDQGHDRLSGEDKYQTQPKPDVTVAVNTPTAPLTADNATVKAVNDTASNLTHMSDQTQQNVVETENRIFLILGSWQGGLAGALLVVSSLFRGLKMGLFMLASTLLILVIGRYLVIPTGGFVKPENAGMVFGTILAFGGFLIGREN